MSDHNPYEPAVSVSKRDLEQAPAPTLDLDPQVGPEREKELPAAPASETVPDGTIKEVLDWVGDDKDRAKAAVDAESNTDDPRPSLIKKLEKVLEA